MATVDIARRNRPGRRCFPVAGQRTGVLQQVQLLSPQVGLVAVVAYLRLCFRVGNFLRLVLATLLSSFRLIDLYMLLDAPRSDDFDFYRAWPRVRRRPPFVVSLILQAYKEISRAEAETDLFQLAARWRHKK